MSRDPFDDVDAKLEAARRANRKQDAEFEEEIITGIHDLRGELRAAVEESRQRQPSQPEIHVHVARPDSAPPSSASVPPEVKLAWKHRGKLLRIILAAAAFLGAGAGMTRILEKLGLLHP